MSLSVSGNTSSDVEMDPAQLEGDIVQQRTSPESPGGPEKNSGAYDTLDEPVLTSINRDLKAVGQKLLVALLPTSTSNILMREWDLWGPLFLCLYIGLLLQGMSKEAESSRFTTVFMLMWTGTMIVTYNTVFMQKATISIFQCICVVGYCLAPEALAVTIFELLHLLGVASDQIIIRLLLVTLSVVWSSFASTNILRSSIEEEKKVVVMGPIIIFYVIMGILVALYTYSDY